MKKGLLFLCVFLTFWHASAESKVDSLLRMSVNASEKQKIGLYLELARTLTSDSAKSNSYSQKAYQLAVKNHQTALRADALYEMGETSNKSLDYAKAAVQYQKALSVYEELNDSLKAATCHRSIGLCYIYLGRCEKAISEFIEGMKLCEHDTLLNGHILYNIGQAHIQMKNSRDAIGYYSKSLHLISGLKEAESANLIALNYNGMGEVYKSINRPDSALINFKKAGSFNKKSDFQAIILNNMGGIYLNYRDSLNKAIDCYKRSWAIFRQLGLYQYEAEFKQGIGFILFRQGKYKQAIDAFKSSIEVNDRFNRGFRIKSSSNKLLSMAYERTGDYKSALAHMKLYSRYADSLSQKDRYIEIATLEKQYETEKKEREIERLKANQKLTLIELQKNKQLKQLGLITAVLFLLFGFFVLVKYIEKIKSSRILEEKNRVIAQSEQELKLLNAAKNKFFSIIAHDLKNPLHHVLGYSYLLSKDYDRFSEKERQKFALDIHQSTNNIFRLLQNLLEWSRSQTGRLLFSPTQTEYQLILDNSLNLLKANAEQKKIAIQTENEPGLKIFADPTMIETVLRNLIANAIKFTPEGGLITIAAKNDDGQTRISVKDNGVGLSEEDRENVFKIDSKVKRKGTNNEDGSGLGLILCTEFVLKHGGEIWVESTPGNGSEFVFTLPDSKTETRLRTASSLKKTEQQAAEI